MRPETYRQSAVDLVRDAAWATVTPRMLLSHTSGLANFAFVEPDICTSSREPDSSIPGMESILCSL